MGNKTVKQHFDIASKTGVLKISDQRLCEFPTILKNFPNCLKTLDLSYNRFVTIPDDIGKFTILKLLNFSSNRLISLNSIVGELTKLETLNASNNFIVQIPKELCNLKNLKQVILTNNQINEFPIMFAGLKHLDILDLSRNKLTIIPSQIKDFYVTELNCNQNQITQLAVELAECPKLKTLRLEENCLQITEIHTKILKESVICNLTVEGNLFQSKQFNALDGYDEYMARYTAVKKKMF